jgi:hypothetical protein
MKGAATIVAIIVFSISLPAQWPKYQEPGPRDTQGRVLMEGPPPRLFGSPDLTGDWTRADRDPLPSELAGIVTARGDQTRGIPVEPPTAPFAADPNSKGFGN